MLWNVFLSTILKGMLSSLLFYSTDELKFWRLRRLPWLPQVSKRTRLIVRFESKSSFCSHVFHQCGSLVSSSPSDTCFIPDEAKSVLFFVNSQHNVTGADRGIFVWGVGEGGGGPNFCSKRTVGLFCGKLLLPHTPHTLPPVAVAHYNSLAPYRVFASRS